MGTRFASTQESPLHHNIKENIVRHGESDTVYGSNFDGLYARVMKTPAGERCPLFQLTYCVDYEVPFC